MPSRRIPFFWKTFYNLLIVPLLFAGFHFLAWLARRGFSQFEKVNAGRVGRQNLFQDLTAQLQKTTNAGPRFWVHASSMGEYEQARPLLQEIKKRFPNALRVLTLFSPSVYAHLNRAHVPAEAVSYLPFDSLRNAKRFCALVKPDAALVIRHDYWPNHLWEAQRCGAVLVLADASVSANASSFRHKPFVRNFNRALLESFDAIGAVSAEAAQNLLPLIRRPERVQITGDTRYDQVLFRTQSKRVEEVLPERWRNGAPILVAGSTWPSDEEVLLPAFVEARKQVSSLRLILVPHEPTSEHLLQLEKQLENFDLAFVRLSLLNAERESGRRGEWESRREGERERGRWGELEMERFSPTHPLTPSPAHPVTPSVLLVDRIGILATLYGAGQVAFVGGSFGPGVHSVLEAAVHGVPVMIGPRFRNSPEATVLAKQNLLTVISNAGEGRQKLLEFFQNQNVRQEKGAAHREFVLARCGASARVVDMLAQRL